MEAFKESKMRKTSLLSAVLATVVAGVCFAAVPARAHGDRVSVKDSYMAGTVLIRTGERRLYYFTGSGEAIRYPVGVGRAGMQWSGTAFIDGKYIRPAWSPPPRSAGIIEGFRGLFPAAREAIPWAPRP